MTVDFSHLAPYIWILAAVLIVIAVFILIRFFWQHVLKFLLQVGAFILVILALWYLLRYLKIF